MLGEVQSHRAERSATDPVADPERVNGDKSFDGSDFCFWERLEKLELRRRRERIGERSEHGDRAQKDGAPRVQALHQVPKCRHFDARRVPASDHEPTGRKTQRASQLNPLSNMQKCAFPSGLASTGKVRVTRTTIASFASSSVPSAKRRTLSAGKQSMS